MTSLLVYAAVAVVATAIGWSITDIALTFAGDSKAGRVLVLILAAATGVILPWLIVEFLRPGDD